MSAHDDNPLNRVGRPSCDDNVIAFPARVRQPDYPDDASSVIDMQRYPVDIRGYVTFGRLLSGLSSVGLTVHVDARAGRVVITDEVLE